jgi:glucose/arabinose dehydrogenase
MPTVARSMCVVLILMFCVSSMAHAGAYQPNMGPVVSTAVLVGNGNKKSNIAYRGIVVPLDVKGEQGIVFDADTMRIAAGWVKGGINFNGLPFSGGHGAFPSLGDGNVFTNRAAPGWANVDGSLKDPRRGPVPALGHLPKSWAHYKGLYMLDDKVVFKFTVGKNEVLETHALETHGDINVIVRTIQIAGNHSAMAVVVADAPGGTTADGLIATVGKDKAFSLVSASNAPKGSKLVVKNGALVLELPAGSTTTFNVKYASAIPTNKEAVSKALATKTASSIGNVTQGGKTRWPVTFTTKGQLATEKEAAVNAYVIDRLTVPYNNKYESRMRIGGMDFFADGKRAAVSTWDGDVWIVSGIDEKLENLTWKRYATGLHEALGLKIVDDVIYTVDDMQITRFHDLNKDGEADFYENFNNDWELTSGFHAFCFDLHTDKAGNFYFAFGSPVRGGGRSFERMGEHHGSVLRVSKDGSKLERYASGLRAPNGIGVGPDGQVTTGDNEGTFVPRCPINWVKKGDFLGVIDSAENLSSFKTTPTVSQRRGDRKQYLDPNEMPKPLAWLPKNVDNSGGGQVWVTTDKWGPFQGELLHMSYGKSALYLVLKENKGGQMQGGVVKFPLKFTSSAMRARVNTRDGQIYVAGLKGWQTNAAKNGGFDRVRYTGKPVFMPSGLKVKSNGVEISFTQKLDPELANDADSFSVKGSDILWSHAYGSGNKGIGERPGQAKGPGNIKVTSAKLLADGNTIFVTIENMQPIHQMEIKMDLEDTKGNELRTTIYNTVHVLK